MYKQHFTFEVRIIFIYSFQGYVCQNNKEHEASSLEISASVVLRVMLWVMTFQNIAFQHPLWQSDVSKQQFLPDKGVSKKTIRQQASCVHCFTGRNLKDTYVRKTTASYLFHIAGRWAAAFAHWGEVKGSVSSLSPRGSTTQVVQVTPDEGISLSLCGVMSTAVMYAHMDKCAYVCFCYRKEMGRWTLHLSVGIGLLAVLLTCCCAEGEESELLHCLFLAVINV